MAEKEKFFEIKEMKVCGDLKANLVMVEDNGKGAAYLGWCENLALDTPVTLSTNVEQTPLMLPFADLALLTCDGSPIPAPEGWEHAVVRPLTFQDYLLFTIEQEMVFEPEAVYTTG